jgi:diguanylate cyclase (GGDEF)-like protein
MLEKLSETLVSHPKKQTPASSKDACLVLIYPTGPGMGLRFALADQNVIIGRSPSCQIHIDNASVSRQHARIDRDEAGVYFATDLQSTNGTFVNDVPANQTIMKDGDYLKVGNCIYRFLAGGNIEADYHEVIYNLTIIDALTSCPNKRFFNEFLDREIARSNRHKRPLSVLMIDIDNFKTVNDTMGHLAGDAALKAMATLIRETIRREELFSRFGGEEFAIILPETKVEQALILAEKIRAIVENNQFEFESKRFNITVSIGVATTDGDPPATIDQLIQQSDARLYMAKNAGRNKVVFQTPSP